MGVGDRMQESLLGDQHKVQQIAEAWNDPLVSASLGLNLKAMQVRAPTFQTCL